MRRGIGRLRAGGGGFSPISVFAGSAAGLWLDPSDISTGFTDSAGTIPQTASGQQTGKRLDKSGRANHVLQATANSRPEYDVISGISSDFFDGLDDGYSTATFVAGTLTSNMDCFYAVKRASSSAFIPFSAPGSVNYFGNCDPAVSTANNGTGASTTFVVDGVAVSGGTAVTSASLNTAVTVSAWHIVEARNLDLSTAGWTQFIVSGFSGGSLRISGDIGGVIVCPAQSTAVRNSIRTWLGNKVGLTL